MTNENNGLDLAGLGKVAKAIPSEVYTKTADTMLNNLNKLLAPITETTDGLGRYIRQKFDNMVEVEKAVAIYTLDKAINKAQTKAKLLGKNIISPAHQKSFVKTLDEASKETNALLHEMWENLLADQLVNQNFHPHFVEVLSNFSPKEALLLLKLKSINEITARGGRYASYSDDGFTHWIENGGATEFNKWDYSCVLLHEFRFVDLLSPPEGSMDEEERYNIAILYRTSSGDFFLKSVSP